MIARVTLSCEYCGAPTDCAIDPYGSALFTERGLICVTVRALLPRGWTRASARAESGSLRDERDELLCERCSERWRARWAAEMEARRSEHQLGVAARLREEAARVLEDSQRVGKAET